MRDDACPASLEGLGALDDRVVRNDWAWLCRYRAENARLDPAHPPRVVFMGDSITQGWIDADPAFFAQGYADRGISGQTTPQMLVRFWQDVIALRPSVVHIMGGTNDIAGNTGPTTPEAWQNAVRAMVTLAKANHIAVIVGSIPPSNHFGWSPAQQPAPWITRLNAWLKDYAKAEGLVYADYHSALAGPQDELPAGYGADGVHPNSAGYAVMRPIAEQAIKEAEKKALP
ncbi:MAG: SGNH/GDSL hydrolase family protein [Sphingomonadales bacterium]|nr:SGNH/GDSL hydrolase family protein [Sphingomonadales bacterium]